MKLLRKRVLIPAALFLVTGTLFLVLVLRGTLATSETPRPSTSSDGALAHLWLTPEGRKVVRCAIVIETVHLATLVHDDVIDLAPTRRGRASLNARWGNTRSVLFGDLLVTQAFGRLVREGNLELLRLITASCHELLMGELLELHHEGNLDMDAKSALEGLTKVQRATTS